MLFTSISFLIFLPVVFVLYWFVTNKSLKHQNLLLLGASYFFYASWNWKFLFLLFFSTFLDYFTGLKMSGDKNQPLRKFWFWLSICVNLGFLGIFKYYNFFISSFAAAFDHAGFHVHLSTLQIVLPVGISFYTFHGLSYVIDIYKGRIAAEKNFVDYAVFVSFFPLLVAGPIERATHLLPQIKEKRSFDYAGAVDGLRQILWGLFKKIVIADQCADYVNVIFNNTSYSGSTYALGAILFAFQIYGDFSGYSDIAIGTARLFGIRLLRNFAFPYFSRSIAEFWRRWHISLSTWFRDYLYIPLGGSRGSTWIRIRNIFIIFLVSGFWHGANWTFIVWGLLHALYMIPSVLLKTNRDHLDIVAKDRYLPRVKELLAMAVTFGLTTFAWLFFRAKTVGLALLYTKRIFSPSLFRMPSVKPLGFSVIIFVFIIIEWMGRQEHYAIAKWGVRYPMAVRWAFYYVIAIIVFFCSFGTGKQFIYFQF